jgi:integrase
MPKPHPDFPLYQHASGQWAKRIRGRVFYFGSWRADPDGTAAMLDYKERLPWLLKGREPPEKERGRYTVRDVLNVFLTRKKRRLEAGELAPLSYGRYKHVAESVRDFLGATTASRSLTDDDFERLRTSMAQRLGCVALNVEIGVVRSIFQLGQRKGMVSRKINFAECFERPPAKVLRMHRDAQKQRRQFTPAEVRALLAAATPNAKVMILLGIQAGFGNTETTLLTTNCLTIEPGWLNLPRSKTGVMRRIPLWQETIDAINAALAARAKPKRPEDENMLLLSRLGRNLVSGRHGDRVNRIFTDTMKACGLTGRSFYDLRRNFRTIAKRAKEPDALNAIMGHVRPETDMADRYNLAIDDADLRKVVQVVHDWLFEPDSANGKRKPKRK